MIRAAQHTDAAQIAEIWNAVIRDTTITFTNVEKSVADIEAMLTDQPVFVLTIETSVIGFATYSSFRSGPGYRHTAEHSIYLSPQAQGQGFGRELLSQIEADACANGIKFLIGGLAGDNISALKFHEKLGFQQVGFLPGVGFKFDRPHDLVLVQKAL